MAGSGCTGASHPASKQPEKRGGQRQHALVQRQENSYWVGPAKAVLEVLMKRVFNLLGWRVAAPGSNHCISNRIGSGKTAWLGNLEWLWMAFGLLSSLKSVQFL